MFEVSLKFGARIFLSFLSCLAVVPVAYLTLTSNQQAGVYGVDADSIAIPLVGSFFTSITLFAFLLTAAGLVALARNLERKAKIIGHVFAALIGIFTMLLAADEAYSWAIPNHFAMAFSYISVIFTALALAYHDIARTWTKTSNTS